MQRFTGILFLTGAFILAGSSVIAGRYVTDMLGPFTITAVSLFFALLGLLPLGIRRLVKAFRWMSARDWVQLLLQALFGIFLFRLFLLQGLIHTSAGEAGILTGATPAATALFAYFFLKERLYKVRLLGIICTVIGILIIQGIFMPGAGFSVQHSIGNLLVLCAAICESSFNVLSRVYSINHTNQSQLDPIAQSILVSWLALLLCLGPALSECPVSSLSTLSLLGWGALVWYGLFVTALAFIFWYSGIKSCDTTVAAAISGLMPFTAMVLSVLLLGEHPEWWHWLGGLLVVLGMVFTGLDQANNKPKEIIANPL